jgi:hypothetical protein
MGEEALADQAAAITERRQHIKDMARCQQCGASRKQCDAGIKETGGPEGMCCTGGIGHRHIENAAMVDQLIKEIMAGEVRTVAEAYPPPVQGPQRVTMTWLLEQAEWWYPQGRPPVRVAEMDKPHRWNVARWLERRAPVLEAADRSRGIWADAPDDVWASLSARAPEEFLQEQPLYRALTRGLPDPRGKKGRLLAARAMHWHTCPMRKAHPAPSAHCLCIREGGRVVGATNDPAVSP